MIVVFLIDLVVVISLILASRRGVEAALPLFCFYLVLMPLESRFVIPGLFDLGTDRVAVLTLLILFFVRREKRNSWPIPMRHLIFLHIAWVVVSTVYSISVATSAKQLLGQVIEYYLLYYMLLRVISSVETVYKILYAMTLAIGLCCFFGLLESYTFWSILNIFPSNLWIVYGGPGPLYVEWGRGLRIRSTFPHPILLGDAIAMSIPVTMYLISVRKEAWHRIVLWLSLILMFWAIYKTSSRGPWIATGISCVLLFFLVRNRVRRYLTVIALLMVTVLVLRPGVWDTIANLYESSQDTDSPVGASYEYRNVLTHAITSAVAKEPGRMVLGYGLGTFREKGLEIEFLGEVKRWYTCDNNWAAFLYETGYGGLVIMSALLLTPLLMTLRSYWRLPRPEKNLCAVIFIVLAAFCFSLMSVAGYAWGQQGFMAWILISLSMVYPKIAIRDQKRETVQASIDSAKQVSSQQTPVFQLQ